MSRGFFSAISAVTLVTGTALYYLWKSNDKQDEPLVDRLVIKKTLITLRKRAYSTLREISFIVNHIRTLEGDLQVKKISEIFMRDGGSGEKKLQAIEALVLKEANIKKSFEESTNYYCRCDIQIKLLLELFRKDLNMALQGVIQSYHGPLPSNFTSEKVLKIEEQIIKRRMSIICKKYIEKASNQECLALEGQMQNQEYLLEEGISHEKEPNEKIFMSMLQHYYRHDYEFKQKFERLEMDLQMFMIQIENKHNFTVPKQPVQKFSFNKKKNKVEIELERQEKQKESESYHQPTKMRVQEKRQY